MNTTSHRTPGLDWLYDGLAVWHHRALGREPGWGDADSRRAAACRYHEILAELNERERTLGLSSTPPDTRISPPEA